MKRTFCTLFVIKRKAVRKDGRAPILCRITVNGTSVSFASQLHVKPEMWNVKENKAEGKGSEVKQINKELDKIRKGLRTHYEKIFNGIGPMTADRVKSSYLGFDRSCRTLMQVFESHNHDYAHFVENGIRQRSTYERYEMVFRHLQEFLEKKYRLKDIAFADLRLSFIMDFESFLRTKKNLSNNTVCVYITPLRKMISIAQNNGWLDYNPFANYHLSLHRNEREILTMSEINRIIQLEISPKKKNVALTRDMFIFCTFTGISFIDLKGLTCENIKETNSGKWISFQRQKTGVWCNIPLLQTPMKILESYRCKKKKGTTLFELPHYVTMICALRRIIQLCNIDKKVSWHTSRHSFASEICLMNGVPIETISRMLGHTDVKTTRIYAQTSNTIIERDMLNLAEHLKGL